MTEEEQREIAEWCVQTCLLFGTDLSTAYHVAAEFVRGVARAREQDEPEQK